MCRSTQKLKDITYNGRFVYFNIKIYLGGWYLERQHDQHKGKGHWNGYDKKKNEIRGYGKTNKTYNFFFEKFIHIHGLTVYLHKIEIGDGNKKISHFVYEDRE